MEQLAFQEQWSRNTKRKFIRFSGNREGCWTAQTDRVLQKDVLKFWRYPAFIYNTFPVETDGIEGTRMEHEWNRVSHYPCFPNKSSSHITTIKRSREMMAFRLRIQRKFLTHLQISLSKNVIHWGGSRSHSYRLDYPKMSSTEAPWNVDDIPTYPRPFKLLLSLS